MYKIIFIIVAALTLCCAKVCGQKAELKPPVSQDVYVYFNYDATGNRVLRSFTISVLPPIIVNGDDDDGLTTSSSELFEDGKTLENGSQECEIHVYPNPVRDELIVDILKGDEEKNYRLMLFDSAGKLLKDRSRTGNGSEPVDFGNYPTGTYLLIINSSKEKFQFKIIKEN